MSDVTTPFVIAEAITENCNKFHMTEIDWDTWSAEQYRLWAWAAEEAIATDVLRLLCPSVRES